MELVNATQSLEEALQLIEDWDTDIVALLDLDDASTTRHRKKTVQVERHDLLEELERLQTHLALKRNVEASSPPQANTILCQEWQAIALRQREQRLAAFIENERLRMVLEFQLKRARRAAILIHKVELIGHALGTNTVSVISAYNGPRVDISDHITRLDVLAHQAPDVFSTTRFPNHDIRDVQVHPKDPSFLSIELKGSWRLPFDMTSVVKALWVHSTRLLRTEQTASFHDFYATEGTLISHFVATNQNRGTIGSSNVPATDVFTHGQVATRLEPASRDGAVVLISDIEAQPMQNGQCRSHIKGEVFLRIDPLTADVCRVMWYRRIMVSAPRNNKDTTTEFSRWSKSFSSHAMRKTWWQKIDSKRQSIENMLLTPMSP